MAEIGSDIPRRVAILRRPDGLHGILSRRNHPFAPPLPITDEVGDLTESYRHYAPYVEQVIPLADMPHALSPEKRQLLDCWQSLSNVRTWDARLLARVLHVLGNTIPDPLAHVHGIPAWSPPQPVPPSRATAAHPRAFRGTKHKPPKAPRPASLDLRPQLCVPASEERILRHLQPHLEGALERVRRMEPPRSAEVSCPSEVNRTVHVCCGAEGRARVAALPALFRRHLLWSLRDCDWACISGALAAYWALDLERNELLRCCVARLLSLSPTIRSVAWCQALALLPTLRRVVYAELLIESSAYSAEPDARTVEALVRTDGLSCDRISRHRMYVVLCAARERKCLDPVLDGFVLANEFDECHEFQTIPDCTGACAAVRAFAQHARASDNWWPPWALTLWDNCATLDGLAPLLAAPDLQRLDAGSACGLVRLLTRVADEDLSSMALARKWQMLRAQALKLIDLLAETPREYREKAIRHLRELAWIWDADSAGLGKRLPSYVRLLTRLCRPPFSTLGHDDLALTDLTFAPVEHWQKIEQSPDESFLQLERRCRRENTAWLIGRGLRGLAHQLPELTAAAFRSQPSKLVKSAEVLGALRTERCDDLIWAFRRHPLCVKAVEPGSITWTDLTVPNAFRLFHGTSCAGAGRRSGV